EVTLRMRPTRTCAGSWRPECYRMLHVRPVDWRAGSGTLLSSGRTMTPVTKPRSSASTNPVRWSPACESRARRSWTGRTSRRAGYPDGPADSESLFLLDGELYLITKGRQGPVRLYRLPRDGEQPATLEYIAELGPKPSTGERIGAATATPDGRWVVLRTPSELRFYRADRLLAGDTGDAIVWDATSLGHPQGESVEIDDEGNVWLTSEAEKSGQPAFAHVSCTLP